MEGSAAAAMRMVVRMWVDAVDAEGMPVRRGRPYHSDHSWGAEVPWGNIIIGSAMECFSFLKC